MLATGPEVGDGNRWAAVVVLSLTTLLLPMTAYAMDASAAESSGSRDWERASERPIPDDETLLARNAVIGDIIIRINDIFDTEDPAEDNWSFRAVNKIHPKTRPIVVQRDLLFKRGDRYDPTVIHESERILRGRRFFYDADIQVIRYNADNTVDLVVTTRDVWTLRAGANFDRAGGANNYSLAVEDTNILGTGKEFHLEYESTVDRSGTLVSYFDPNMRGSRVRLDATYADNSDGNLFRLDVGRRFYSFDSRWAAGMRAVTNERLDRLFDLGQEVDSFRHQVDFLEISGGISSGFVNGRTARWTAGATYKDDRFGPAEDFNPFDFEGDDVDLGGFGLTDFAPGSFGPGGIGTGGFDPLENVPEDRRLVYPWVGFEWVEDRFTELHDLDRIGRTEDLNLGHRLQARIGFSSTAFGSTRDQVIFDSVWSHGLRPGARQMFLQDFHAGGRVGDEGSENILVGARFRYYWRNLSKGLFFIEVTGDLAENMDPENQLLLGGDSGLRGYPLRYQDGDRRFRFTAEQRFFSNWHPFRLARVGGAIFFDMGRAWFQDPTNGEDLGLLKDVGIGLRLSSSRGARGGVTHLDVAFPLDGDTSIKRVQWLISTRETF